MQTIKRLYTIAPYTLLTLGMIGISITTWLILQVSPIAAVVFLFLPLAWAFIRTMRAEHFIKLSRKASGK